MWKGPKAEGHVSALRNWIILGYSDGFDLALGLAPNQSHVNNPGTNDPIP